MRRIVLIVSVVASIVVVAPRADATTTLTVSPDHGIATAPFTATFFSQTGPECFSEGLTVTFHWDSPTAPAYGSALMDAECTAKLTAPPPGSPAVGGHRVVARFCLMSCETAATRYTIDPTPPPTTTTTTTTTTTIPPVTIPPPPSTTTTTTTTTLATTTTTAAPTTTTTSVPVALAPEEGDSEVGGGGFVESTPGPGDVDTRVHVVVTNLGLTLLLLLILVLTSAVFNSTLESNRDRIAAWWRRWLGGWPFPRLGPSGRIVAMLVVTGSLYALLSPGFRFDRTGVILLLALTAGLGALTYVGEGGAAWFARARLGVRAGVRVQLAAVVAALACVLLTRATGFQPAILFGFVASTAVAGSLDRSQAGRGAFYPMVMVLGAGLVAFAALGAIRSGPGGGWVHDAAEALTAVVFVAALEAVVFSMVPIAFMDGRAVFDWSRWRWAALTGAALFCFWQLLINPSDSYLDAFRQPPVVAVLVIAGGYVVVTAATWGWFRWKAAE